MISRRANGYALVTVLVIGSFAIVFLMALANITTSAVRVASANKWHESLRNAAEIGMDYAVSQFNTQQTTPTGIVVPPDLYATSGVPNVQVTVSPLLITDWSTFSSVSSVYMPMLDPTRTKTDPLHPNWSLGNLNPVYNGGYRILLSTATNGVYSKSIRVVLKARLDTPPNYPQSFLTKGIATTAQGLFSIPFFSNGAMTLNSPSLVVEGYNSQNPSAIPIHTLSTPAGVQYAAYDLAVSTNTNASISAGTTIAGDLSVSNLNTGSAAVSVPAQPTVDGRVVMNNASPSVNAPTGSAVPNASPANVLANADTVSNPLNNTRLGYNATLPSVVNAPVTSQTTVIPSPTSSNIIDQQTTMPESTQAIAQLAALSQNNVPITSANQTTGASGSYSTSGLITDGVGGSPVVIQNSSAPVSFYVQDATAPSGQGGTYGTNAVNLDTSKIAAQNTDPRDLQIYYQGSQPVNVNVNSNSFNGLIYAPNAPVTISGVGTFSGGIVGGSVTVTLSGTLKIATDLSVSSAAAPPGWAQPMDSAAQAALANKNAGLQIQLGPGGYSLIQGWQPVTWQEL